MSLGASQGSDVEYTKSFIRKT